jgi:CRP-like cAMP-binding protein
LEVFLEISGNRLTLNEMGPGQAVGEMAVIDGKPRSANVIALDETSVYCLDHQSFMDALLQQPPMITVFLTDVAANLRFANTVIEKAAEWSRSVAAANYDKAKVALQETESGDADRFASFLRAFSAMVTEVQAREEAYQREVQELRIIIDKEKRDRELKAIESSTAFQEIAEQGRRLREARRKRLDD